MPYKRGATWKTGRFSPRKRARLAALRRAIKLKRLPRRKMRIPRYVRRARPMAPPKLVTLRTAGIAPPVRFVKMEYRGVWGGLKPLAEGPIATGLGYSFKCNSIYDPSNGGLGSAFNQSTTLYKHFQQFYNKYEVMSSFLVITLRQTEVAPSGTLYMSKWGVLYDDDGTSTCLDGSHSWTVAAQRPTTKFRTFVPKTDGDEQQTIKMYWKRKAQPEVGGENKAAFGSDPANTEHWVPFIAYAQSGIAVDSFPSKYSVEVYIRYNVRLSEPVDLEDIAQPMDQDH